MRFALVDLLLRVGTISVATVGGQAVLSHTEWRYSQGVLVALAILGTVAGEILVLTPLYRTLSLLPLHLPSCPHCGKVPTGYRVVGGEWPTAKVECGCLLYTSPSPR